MSQWTHVVRVIRFDGLPMLGMDDVDCGRTVDWENAEDAWDKCTVPCGSEGSLQISDWRNPCTNALAYRTVSIFGDLRDYEDEEEIIQYFKRITKDQMVRQACFTISVEYRQSRHFVWQLPDEVGNGFFKEVK